MLKLALILMTVAAIPLRSSAAEPRLVAPPVPQWSHELELAIDEGCPTLTAAGKLCAAQYWAGELDRYRGLCQGELDAVAAEQEADKALWGVSPALAVAVSLAVGFAGASLIFAR